MKLLKNQCVLLEPGAVQKSKLKKIKPVSEEKTRQIQLSLKNKLKLISLLHSSRKEARSKPNDYKNQHSRILTGTPMTDDQEEAKKIKMEKEVKAKIKQKKTAT